MLFFNKKNFKFSEIYSNYYSVVHGTIYSKVGEFSVADDLTQEVFMNFLTNIDKIKNVRAWLFAALRNEVYDYYRRQKNKTGEADLEESEGDLSLTFVNGFRDTRVILEEAIEDIQDEVDRIIFDLIAIQYFTYEEVSQQIGLSKRQVRYRYGKIVESIQDFLAKKGIKNIEDLL